MTEGKMYKKQVKCAKCGTIIEFEVEEFEGRRYTKGAHCSVCQEDKCPRCGSKIEVKTIKLGDSGLELPDEVYCTNCEYRSPIVVRL